MCRYTPVSPQPPANDPVWEGNTTGTIVTQVCDRLPDNGAYIPNDPGTPVWVPPGAATVDPETVARAAVARFGLKAIEIGMVPEAGPDKVGAVGMPVWLWVADPKPVTVGPINDTATDGGVTVTLDARVASIDWDMGDGTIVHCEGDDVLGTPYEDAYDLSPSPTCGHVYERQGNPYTITATSHWQVDWTDGAQAGTIPVELTATTTRTVGELQVLTVQ